MMLTQELEDEKWSTVRIPTDLLDAIESLILNLKDEFGLPIYRNKTDFVTKAAKDLLRKHSSKKGD